MFVRYYRVVMALIRGLMGKFPCPVCLIPREELSKGSNTYRLRSSGDAKALRARARDSTTAEVREQVLSSESLRDVDVSLSPQFCFVLSNITTVTVRVHLTPWSTLMSTELYHLTNFILTTRESSITCGWNCKNGSLIPVAKLRC